MKSNCTLLTGGKCTISLKSLTFILLLFSCFLTQAQNIGDYRSTGDGNWNTVGIWQMWFGDEIGWDDAPSYPGNSTLTATIPEVTILPCHKIKIAAQATYYNIETLKIQGQLIIDNRNLTFASPLEDVILDGGAIYWLNNGDITLPIGASLTILPASAPDPCPDIETGLQSSGCNASKRIFIGPVLYATCNGKANAVGGSFEDINDSNGTLSADPRANPIAMCEVNTDIPQLFGIAIRYNANLSNITYNWTLVSKPVGSTFVFNSTTEQNPVLSYLDKVGDYKFNLEVVAATPQGNVIDDKDIIITVGGTTTFGSFNGQVKWDNGIPSSTNHRNAIINHYYTTNAQGSFDACSCQVNNGGTLNIATGNYVKLEKELINNGVVTIQNNGNLIQVNDDAENVGIIEFQKSFNFSSERNQYNLLISPVIGQNLKEIYPGVTTSTMYYRESNNYFYSHNGAYTAGKGLAVKEPSNNSTTAKFYGIPFNGVLYYNLEYTEAGKGFNLIGNPYPSTMDIQAFYLDNQDYIGTTFYFWDNRGNTEHTQQGSTYNGSNYAVYNAASDTGNGIGEKATGATGASRIPTRYVNAGTAFIVQASTASPVQFKNAYRNNTLGPTFFGKGNFTTEKDRYWLSLETPGGLEYTNAVVYLENGQNILGLEDSEAMGTSDEIFTLSDNTELAINGRAPFELTDVIPLGVSHFINGTYSIGIYKAEGIFNAGQSIYLRDQDLNVVHNLSEGPYEYTSAAGKFTNRFEILYQYTPEEENQNPEPEGNNIQISKQGNFFVVNSSIDKISEVEIYNLDGRQVYKRKNINSQSHKIQSNALERSVLFVHVLTDKGERVIISIVNN